MSFIIPPPAAPAAPVILFVTKEQLADPAEVFNASRAAAPSPPSLKDRRTMPRERQLRYGGGRANFRSLGDPSSFCQESKLVEFTLPGDFPDWLFPGGRTSGRSKWIHKRPVRPNQYQS